MFCSNVAIRRKDVVLIGGQDIAFNSLGPMFGGRVKQQKLRNLSTLNGWSALEILRLY